MAQQTFTATNAGDRLADINCPIGAITVTVDPSSVARITVSTTDTEGPVADAVNGALFHDIQGSMTLSIPEIRGQSGGFASVSHGGTTFQSFGSGSVFSGINVHGGQVTIDGGDVYVGGKRVVSGGRVVAEAGTEVGGAGNGTITVEVTLPSVSSSLRCETTSASVAVHGNLEAIDFYSVSGSLSAAGVYSLRACTTSGGILADAVDGDLDAESVSGRITIGAYNGSDASLKSVSGSLALSATPAARGRLSARTVSGAIGLRGTGALDVRTRSVSGHIFR